MADDLKKPLCRQAAAAVKGHLLWSAQTAWILEGTPRAATSATAAQNDAIQHTLPTLGDRNLGQLHWTKQPWGPIGISGDEEKKDGLPQIVK